MYKTINNFENYLIYDDGKVYSSKTKRFLKPYIIKKGHYRVVLCKKGQCKKFLVHRLVADAFIPNYKKMPFVCHNDSNPKNNNVENLRWDDAVGNMNDRRKRGLYCQIGEKNYRSKLKESEVKEIKEMAKHYKPKEIFKYYKNKISLPTIYDIREGRSWGHIK